MKNRYSKFKPGRSQGFVSITLVIAFAALLALRGHNIGHAQTELEDPEVQRHAANYYHRKYRVDLDEAYRRIAIQDRAAGIEDDLVGLLGDQYAGIWYDHDDSGRLKIGMTERAWRQADGVRALISRYGVDAEADLVQVRFTEGELERKQDEVRRGILDLVGSGKARTGYNTMLNSVVVTAIANLTRQEEARIESLRGVEGVTVRRVDAPNLFVRLNACGVRRCDSPYRGGREIIGSVTCTAAFMARQRIAPFKLLAVTAGHCMYFGGGMQGSWASKDEDDELRWVGLTKDFVFPNKDAGVFDVNPYSYFADPPPLAAVVVKNSDDTTYNPNYAIRADAFSSYGQILCRTGRTTGTYCAEVSGLGADQVVEKNGICYTLRNMGELDMCDGLPGDSGGPIYKRHKAYGILSGGAWGGFTCYEFYQGIRGAENALNVDILLAP